MTEWGKRIMAMMLTVGSALVLLMRAADGQGLQPVDALLLVDANGKKVGKMVQPSYFAFINNVADASIAYQWNGGSPFLLAASPNGFERGLRPVVFESTDCSGTPYLSSPSMVPIPPVLQFGDVDAPGHTLYLPDPNATPQTVIAMSGFSVFDGTCGVVSGSFQGAVPALRAVDLDTIFTPPFHAVAAARCCGDCNGDGHVTIDEILTSVNNALTNCPATTANASKH